MGPVHSQMKSKDIFKLASLGYAAGSQFSLSQEAVGITTLDCSLGLQKHSKKGSMGLGVTFSFLSPQGY